MPTPSYSPISDASIAGEQPLTTTLVTALRDNPIAAFAGQPGAPLIQPNTFAIGGSGADGTGLNPSLAGIGFYDFAGLTINSPIAGAPFSIIRVNGDLTLSSSLTLSQAASVALKWNVLAAGGYQTPTGTNPTLAPGGGGVCGRSGTGTGAVTTPPGVDYTTMYRLWLQRRALMGGDSGDATGVFGWGGASIVLVVSGNANLTSATISATGAGGNTGSTGGAGGGGGSIVIICAGVMTLTGATLHANGAGGISGTKGGGGGGGGYIGLVASSFAGTPTLDVSGGTGSGGAGGNGSAGFAEQVILATNTINGLLSRF